MIHRPELDALTREFAALPMSPLTVTAELVPGAHVVSYDPVYLDGLLARAVVDRATQGRGLPDAPDCYWTPLPLQLAWANADGWPLWAASVFLGDGPRDTVYSHKRGPDVHFSPQPNIKSNVGRWMERRIPVPVIVCDLWQARCLGHADAIRELLAGISALGKRRSIGLGEVRAWRVEPAEWTTDEVFVLAERLLHAVPVDNGLHLRGDGPAAPVGWTPPYWKPSLHSLGWPVGAALASPDFYTDTP